MSIRARSRSPIFLALMAVAFSLPACSDDSPSAPTNTTPVANAGSDQLLAVGSVVTLDGSASSDPDGDPLSFTWSLQTPGSSTASLSSASAATPTFTIDAAGTYTVTLTVSDGTASASSTVLVTGVDAYCDAIVDLFPTPVRSNTSPFADTDDAFLPVDFAAGFQFTFFGQTYDNVYLNTNGGLTLAVGVPAFDVEVDQLGIPTIAPFWGDMAAGEASTRPAQMYYEACSDRFIVYYQRIQDFDVAAWQNSGTVTLLADGTIVFDYGDVESEDIMVGIFSGEHTSDDYVAVQDTYSDYDASSGIILFDAFGSGPSHGGQLSGRTITFDPSGPVAASAPRTVAPVLDRMTRPGKTKVKR